MSDSHTVIRDPVLFVIAGPSGAGKKTILDRVRAADPGLAYSVSATTREPRTDEQHGREYYFMSREEFLSAVADDRFIEHAEVHGELYGTLESQIDKLTACGKDVILELDVQGAEAVRRKYSGAVLVFVIPPKFEVLRERLTARGSENAASTARRIETARAELRQLDKFDYVVVNDKLEDAVSDLLAIICAERCRSSRQKLDLS